MRSLLRKLSRPSKARTVFKILYWSLIYVSWLSILGTMDNNPLYQIKVAIGDSNVPTINEGDLLITTPLLPDTLETGTIIIFQNPDGRPISHRIVAVTADGCYLTKGDNCSYIDHWVWPDGTEYKVCQVTGRFIAKIPYVGKLLLNLRNPEV